MEQSGIFRQESMERMESPEQVNAYIKVSRPGIWIVLAALLVLMAAAVVFSLTGSLPETMEVRGRTLSGGEVRCYLPAGANQIRLEGCAAKITLPDGVLADGRVELVSSIPYSQEELAQTFDSDWLAQNLLSSGYCYEIVVRTDRELKEDMLAYVTITTDEVKPIEFILN